MRKPTFAVLTLALGGAALAQTPKYRLELIDPLPGNLSIDGLLVNESGLVAAYGAASLSDRESIRWSGPGQFVTTPKVRNLGPRWLTNDGRLVGSSSNPGGIISLAVDGSFTQLPAVAAVAPNGAYTGTSDFGGQRGFRVGTGASAEYVSEGGGFERLTRVIGMNDAGVVAGTYLSPTESPGPFRAWVARDNIARSLPITVDGVSGLTMARDVDSRGRVLGTVETNGRDRTVIWGEDDAPSLVVPPSGFFISQTVKFNASSTVLAQYASTTGLQPDFFGITTPAGTYRWEDLIEGGTTGMRIQRFSDISDSGYIVGNVAVNGVERAFRMTPLTPVPEPATLAALGFGALALSRRQRKA